MSVSIMQHAKECYMCRRLYDLPNYLYLENHHVIFGTANRARSDEEGLTVWLCPSHHTRGKQAVHNNHEWARLLQMDAQRAFERTHTREEFMSIFGRNYL